MKTFNGYGSHTRRDGSIASMTTLIKRASDRSHHAASWSVDDVASEDFERLMLAFTGTE